MLEKVNIFRNNLLFDCSSAKTEFFSALTALPLFNYHMCFYAVTTVIFIFKFLKDMGTLQQQLTLSWWRLKFKFSFSNLCRVQSLLTQMHKENQPNISDSSQLIVSVHTC